MTKKQILKILLPYKENVENCAIEQGGCSYLTADNKKCAVGKMLKKGVWQNTLMKVSHLLQKYDRGVLLKKYRNVDVDLLSSLQDYHDNLARNFDTRAEIEKIEELTGYKFPELR